MTLTKKWLVLFLNFTLSSTALGYKVSLKQGVVEGFSIQSHHGKDAISFEGIPYGSPPVGSKRFSLPKPAAGWDGVLKADNMVECVQFGDMKPTITTIKGQEDCLQVSVHATKDALTGSSGPLPVMVWIHGGGFALGSGRSDFYGPQWLLDFEVVIVTINYRLGPLGFMSTGDEHLPANLGLWDQRLALTWVRDNIGQFGGDPNMVTIFGESAGSMSVMYHVLSPQSSGLFNAAIAQSGVPTSQFCKSDKHPAYYSRTLAGRLGCDPTASTEDLVRCFKAATLEDMFTESTWDKLAPQGESYSKGQERMNMKPVVDDFSATPFLPEDPLTMIKKGMFNQVPIVLGYNEHEGLVFGQIPDADYETINKNWVKFMSNMMFKREADEVDEDDEKAAIFILENHFNGVKPTPTNNKKCIEFATDHTFMAMNHDMAQTLASHSKSPVYQYRFSYPAPLSLLDFMGPTWKLLLRAAANGVGLDLLRQGQGAAHADELFMMWKLHLLPIVQRWTDQDVEVSERMMTLWTNAAKNLPSGSPITDDSMGFTWEKVRVGLDDYLEIGKDTPKMMMDHGEKARLSIWRDIWKIVPQTLHLKRSKTWANPKLFNKEAAKAGKLPKKEL